MKNLRNHQWNRLGWLVKQELRNSTGAIRGVMTKPNGSKEILTTRNSSKRGARKWLYIYTYTYIYINVGSIPGSGRSPRERNGNPLQYSCLENPMDRWAWQAIVHGISKSRTRLSDFTSLHIPSLEPTGYWVWLGLVLMTQARCLPSIRVLVDDIPDISATATSVHIPRVSYRCSSLPQETLRDQQAGLAQVPSHCFCPGSQCMWDLVCAL